MAGGEARPQLNACSGFERRGGAGGGKHTGPWWYAIVDRQDTWLDHRDGRRRGLRRDCLVSVRAGRRAGPVGIGGERRERLVALGRERRECLVALGRERRVRQVLC